MGRKRRIWLIGLGFAVVGLTVGAWVWSAGPWYHLRTLSSWLEDYGAGPADYKASPKADEVLRHIGTNAVPLLLRRLHATKSSLRARAVLMKAPSWGMLKPTNVSIQVRLMMWVEKYTPIRFHHINPPPSWDHWEAYLGFQALGPLGKSAIPDLVRLAHDPSGVSFYPNVGDMMRVAGVAALADNSSTYVADGDPSNFHGGSFLRNTNSFLVDGEIAAWSLAAIGADSVPPLMELLADPNPRLKKRAAEALGLGGRRRRTGSADAYRGPQRP
jgi:hypothetical protein